MVFFRISKQIFFKVKGIDITEEGVNYTKNNLNLDATCQDFLNWNVKSTNYDIVCMWDTIEHLKKT